MRATPSQTVSALVPVGARRLVRKVTSAWRPGNVAMFHGGRSGSTVVTQLLAEHRRVFWAGELFEPLVEEPGRLPPDWQGPGSFLRRDMRRAGARYYGMEAKFQQVRALETTIPDFVALLEELGFHHFVVLERRNALRALVSAAIAAGHGPYHQRLDSPSSLRRATIPVETVVASGARRSLVDRLARREENFRVLRESLRGRRVLELTYEGDLESDPRSGYHRLCDFLGIEPVPVEVRLGKTNPFPVREMIVNLDQVEVALRDSPYAWMLDG